MDQQEQDSNNLLRPGSVEHLNVSLGWTAIGLGVVSFALGLLSVNIAIRAATVTPFSLDAGSAGSCGLIALLGFVMMIFSSKLSKFSLRPATNLLRNLYKWIKWISTALAIILILVGFCLIFFSNLVIVSGWLLVFGIFFALLAIVFTVSDSVS